RGPGLLGRSAGCVAARCSTLAVSWQCADFLRLRSHIIIRLNQAFAAQSSREGKQIMFTHFTGRARSTVLPLRWGEDKVVRRREDRRNLDFESGRVLARAGY